MAERRCEKTEMLVDQCAHCRPAVRQSYDVEGLIWFAARFDSTLDCGHRAIEGERIAKTTEGEYICGGCGHDD